MTIPVSHLALAEGVSVPLSGWLPSFEQLGIRVVTDVAGRPAISTLAARRLFESLRRRGELAPEARERHSAKLAARYPVSAGGIPALEGATPFESMVAAGGVVSPAAEFGGGRERPNFLAEELAAGQRADDEKKRLASERAKQRLADQSKDKLR